MGERTGIEWCDHTFNSWIGCTALSSACDGCYAKVLVERWGGDFGERRRTAPANWKEPRRWNRKAAEAGVRRRVFCASLADVFDNQVPVIWREDLWELIRETPSLDWLLLTKRPQNLAKMLPPDWAHGYRNVWLGTTTEDQEQAELRIPHLLAVPAAVRFLSCEPLLGPVNLRNLRVARRSPLHVAGFVAEHHDRMDALSQVAPWRLDWVIGGGESGPRARETHEEWALDLRDQCAAAGVAFLWKQWGEFAPTREFRDGRRFMSRVGKKNAGRKLGGVEHSAFPGVRA